jgi:hypothetical protein
MKIKYITEGVFKNPTQARTAREKVKELSNAERVAGVVKKVFIEPVSNYLSWVYNDFMCKNKNPDEIDNQVGRMRVIQNDRFDVTLSCIDEYSFCLNYWEKGKNDVLCGEVERWSYEGMTVEIDDIDLENKKVKLRIVVSEPRLIYGTNNGLNWGTYKDIPSDRVVMFVNMNTLLEERNRKFDESGFVYDALENYLKIALRDFPPVGLPKESADFLKDKNLKIDFEVVYKLDHDILLAGIMDVDSFTLQRYWHIGGFNITVKNKKDYSPESRARDTMDRIYHFVEKEEKRFAGLIPYNVKKQQEDCSWEAYSRNWNLTSTLFTEDGANCNSFEDLVKELKRHFKMKHVKIEGNGHIYYSTGYFKKNYLIL